MNKTVVQGTQFTSLLSSLSLSLSVFLSLSSLLINLYHSGVSEIEWWIGTEPGQSDVGYGNVPVELKDQVCVCIVQCCKNWLSVILY